MTNYGVLASSPTVICHQMRAFLSAMLLMIACSTVDAFALPLDSRRSQHLYRPDAPLVVPVHMPFQPSFESSEEGDVLANGVCTAPHAA